MTSAKSTDTQEAYLYLPRTYIAPINPTPSSNSPIPGARTSILSRFENFQGRPIYRVRIVYESGTAAKNSDRTQVEEDRGVTVEEVDLSAILEYVSPLELERFENAEFKREKEEKIRAEAQKAEKKTSGRRRPLKTPAATIRPIVQVVITRKPSIQTCDDDEGENESAEDTGTSHIHRSVEQGLNSMTDSEADTGDDADELSLPSSGIKMSTFMTTSALPFKSPSKHSREVRVIESTSSSTSISTPAQQLHAESGFLDYPRRAASSASIELPPKSDHHQTKRLRMSKSSSFTSEPSLSRATSHNRLEHSHKNNTKRKHRIKHTTGDPAASDAENLEVEYEVEAIIQHQDLDGVRYYLVKWVGEEEAQDWLTGEDLQGASDLVDEYNNHIGDD